VRSLLRYGSLLRRTDPRVEAARWIEAHVPAGSAVSVQPLFDRTFFGPPLQTDRSVAEALGWLPERGRLAAAREAAARALASRPTYRHVDFVYDLDALRTAGAEYVALSSHVIEHHRTHPERYARELAFYEALRRECEPPVTFEAPEVQDEQIWPVTPPTIWLFTLTAARKHAPRRSAGHRVRTRALPVAGGSDQERT